MIRLRPLSQLRGDDRAMALIEFAFAAPVLAILFVGGYQLSDAVAADRKVTTTDRALADLTTQATSSTAAGIQQEMAAAQQIMNPYPQANAVMRIAQIKIDPTLKASDGQPLATVDWCQLSTGTATCPTADKLYKGTDVSLKVPTGMRLAGTYLIYAEVNYSYVPNVASSMIGTIPLHEQIFMSPRNSASVPCADC